MLKQILQQEHLIDYIWSIINNKETLFVNSSLENTAELFRNCIFILKDDYEEQCNATIYDEDGNELLVIDSIFVNQYSNEDYLNNVELYNQLNKIIKEINKCDKLIILS